MQHKIIHAAGYKSDGGKMASVLEGFRDNYSDLSLDIFTHAGSETIEQRSQNFFSNASFLNNDVCRLSLSGTSLGAWAIALGLPMIMQQEHLQKRVKKMVLVAPFLSGTLNQFSWWQKSMGTCIGLPFKGNWVFPKLVRSLYWPQNNIENVIAYGNHSSQPSFDLVVVGHSHSFNKAQEQRLAKAYGGIYLETCFSDDNLLTKDQMLKLILSY